MSLLIYGANGYTGALIARRAAGTGVPAILAGRRADAGWAGPLLASPAVRSFLERRTRNGPAGPDAEARARGSSLLWAEARDGDGRVVEVRLRAPEPYELTSWTALALATRALRGELPVGFQTPPRACGRGFVLEFPGVTLSPTSNRRPPA